MQILLRIAVEEKFLKNRHVRGRDLVDDDDEIGSGDLLVLPYERLPFVPTRMLSLKQWGAQCRQILPPTGRKLLGLPLRSCAPMRRASIAVRTCSSHRVCSSPLPGTGWGFAEGLELFQFFLGHGASVLPRTTMVPITPDTRCRQINAPVPPGRRPDLRALAFPSSACPSVKRQRYGAGSCPEGQQIEPNRTGRCADSAFTRR